MSVTMRNGRATVRRVDETQKPIVDGLRAAGIKVVVIEEPVDLLARRPSDGRLFLLEVDGITKSRKRKQKQLDFIKAWNVPIVKNFDEAYAWILSG